jgi:hypothetical protein
MIPGPAFDLHFNTANHQIQRADVHLPAVPNHFMPEIV